MKPSNILRIKICCIMSIEEAAMAITAGADALGLVGRMPSGPGVITDDTIADIVRFIPPPISSFLLTSEQSVEGIVAHHRRVVTSTIQIVDAIRAGLSNELRDRLPCIKIVQVIHVTGDRSIEEAASAARYADALLLDSGRPDLAIKELGGTGRTHNWEISRKIREAVGVPIFLAGGLHAGNVGEAIDAVRPFGVDVCSGVRNNGRLDPAKLEAFIGVVRNWSGNRSVTS
ncbi:MAG: phosphoribosylanthranilate isomerase [Ignavibacteriales bacterium]|nr:phosphoribosylanthranilate isomerase [Ignavibacteriales bacterium]